MRTGALLFLVAALVVRRHLHRYEHRSTLARDRCARRSPTPTVTPVRDTIHFDVSGAGCDGAGVCTIALCRPFPTSSSPVQIDGYTQPGASPNANLRGGHERGPEDRGLIRAATSAVTVSTFDAGGRLDDPRPRDRRRVRLHGSRSFYSSDNQDHRDASLASTPRGNARRPPSLGPRRIRGHRRPPCRRNGSRRPQPPSLGPRQQSGIRDQSAHHSAHDSGQPHRHRHHGRETHAASSLSNTVGRLQSSGTRPPGASVVGGNVVRGGSSGMFLGYLRRGYDARRRTVEGNCFGTDVTGSRSTWEHLLRHPPGGGSGRSVESGRARATWIAFNRGAGVRSLQHHRR